MVTCAVDKFNRGLDYINIDIFKFHLNHLSTNQYYS